MPQRFNHDHQPHIVDPNLPAVLPGEGHEFTDEQIKAGIAGLWKAAAPRGAAAKAAKELREEIAQPQEPTENEASEEAKPDAVDRRS